MKSSSPIHCQFVPDLEPGDLAWGRCFLTVDGEPYWYDEDDDGNPTGVEWTWVELLEHLSAIWTALQLEQVCPLGLNPLWPSGVIADLRVRHGVEDGTDERLLKEQYLEEQRQVICFLVRHDLAAGFHGLALPYIHVLRSGRQCMIETEDGGYWAEHAATLDVLTALGDQIYAAIEPTSPDSRGARARARWNARTGLTDDARRSIALGFDAADLIKKLPPTLARQLDDEANNGDGVLLAAARMLRSDLSKESIDLLKRIATTGSDVKPLKRIGSHAEHATSMLNELLATSPLLAPYEQGYELARWLRKKRSCKIDPIEPADLLRGWGVDVIDLEIDPSIDAIAVWPISKAPRILVNRLGKHAAGPAGRRATLAHEICHLLVDRNAALPIVEVLGGATPRLLEQRANAFAAELLLPQAVIEERLKPTRSVTDSLQELALEYGASASLAANQLRNSRLWDGLRNEDKARIDALRQG